MIRWLAWALIPLCWTVAAAYAVYQGGSLAWHLLGFVVVLSLVILFGQLGPLKHVSATRNLRPGPYRAGEALTVTLTVTSSRVWVWPYLLITDNLPPSLDLSEPRFVLNRLARKSIELKYQIPELRRGIYDLGDLTLATGDWFGLMKRVRTVDAPAHLVVWPKTVSLAGARLFPRHWQGENLAQHATRQESTHLRGVREYVPGDRLSHVHWKTSAHTGDFKVKQFEPETQPEFTVMLDRSGRFSRREWEVAVSVAASLLQNAHQNQQFIGLIASDEPAQAFAPASGPAALTGMMNFLSELTHQRGGIAAASIPRSATRLVAITTLKQADSWRGQADVIVAVGPGAVVTLDDLPRYILELTGGRRMGL